MSILVNLYELVLTSDLRPQTKRLGRFAAVNDDRRSIICVIAAERNNEITTSNLFLLFRIFLPCSVACLLFRQMTETFNHVRKITQYLKSVSKVLSPRL